MSRDLGRIGNAIVRGAGVLGRVSGRLVFGSVMIIIIAVGLLSGAYITRWFIG